MSETALATQDEEKTKAVSVAIENGLVRCTSLDEAKRFAAMILQSGMVKGFNSVASILTAIQYGAEMGLQPMQALQNIAMVNGRPSLYGKGLPGVVLSKNIMESFEEWFEGDGDNLTAHCRVKRKGLATERKCSFSVADAKKAGLWGRGTWTAYPRDMMMYKARARAFTLFADVLCGLPVYEDIREIHEQVAKALPKSADPLLKQIGVAEIVKPDAPPVSDADDLAFDGNIPESAE